MVNIRQNDAIAQISELVASFCGEYEISVNLSQDMPDGYETAFGTYDVTVNTLFLNFSMLQSAPEYEILFYLYHELRHALQYLHPELFDAQIQESRQYVVLYNGTCFKLVGNNWHQCVLEGEEDYFTDAYMSLPYEMDANNFAYEKVKTILGDLPELQKLYRAWMPKTRWPYEEHRKLFARIEHGI